MTDYNICGIRLVIFTQLNVISPKRLLQTYLARDPDSSNITTSSTLKTTAALAIWNRGNENWILRLNCLE
jgi:hypothetical protein